MKKTAPEFIIKQLQCVKAIDNCGIFAIIATAAPNKFVIYLILVTKRNFWFRALCFLLMVHLFNYSVNMEDFRLLSGVGKSAESNEIETMAELLLTTLFDDNGALPDEANDIDETKGVTAFIAVIPPLYSFNNLLALLPDSVPCHAYQDNYLSLVNEINPPPPKA